MRQRSKEPYLQGNRFFAHYKVPHYVKFAGDFPMTVTGKIQKFKMREQAITELGLEDAAGVRTA